jgi:UDPglucose 6-dehydrogenase
MAASTTGYRTGAYRIGFVGLGKLGMPCAEVFSEHYDVVGYDIAPRQSAHVRIAGNLAEVVQGRDIIFVAVPTPHEAAYGGERPISAMAPKDFDYSLVRQSLAELNALTSREQLVVLISTVLPGTCRAHLVSLLPNARFIYNPYLIAMGSVKWDLANPEMIIIGTQDGSCTGDAAILQALYAPIVAKPRYAIGTWDEAECIKIFYNTFISMKIGIVNMIQDVAEANGNMNVDVVTDALKAADQRIVSTRYLTAGMGDGGPCHPRDNIALRFLAERLDLGYDMFQAIIESRERQARNLARVVVGAAERRGLPIVINGKSYKPGVPFTDGSYSVLVAHFIGELGHAVTWADPQTGDAPVIDGPAVFLLAHNATVAYASGFGGQATQAMYCAPAPGSTVVDPWRLFPPTPGIEVISYGDTRGRPARFAD